MDYKTPAMFVRQVDGLTIVRLRGPTLTDSHELAHITTEIDNLLAAGNKRLILDLKHVQFAGSAALGMLIKVQNHVTAAGGKLVISHPEQLAELLRVSQTASLFTIANDLSEARKMV